MEHDIKLHMLLDSEFQLEKYKNRFIFGIDRTKAYTKKDLKTLIGDDDLRKQVKTTSTSVCSSLVFDTNGAIFSTNKYVSEDKKSLAKKFISIFAKRIALTGQPSACQECECAGHNTGAAYMSCLSCNFATSGLDYVIK